MLLQLLLEKNPAVHEEESAIAGGSCSAVVTDVVSSPRMQVYHHAQELPLWPSSSLSASLQMLQTWMAFWQHLPLLSVQEPFAVSVEIVILSESLLQMVLGSLQLWRYLLKEASLEQQLEGDEAKLGESDFAQPSWCWECSTRHQLL